MTTKGFLCQKWSDKSPHDHKYTSSAYPNDGLESNYCRNPSKHSTIWCYTTDPNKENRWGECAPIVPEYGNEQCSGTSCMNYRGL